MREPPGVDTYKYVETIEPRFDGWAQCREREVGHPQDSAQLIDIGLHKPGWQGESQSQCTRPSRFSHVAYQ